MFDDHKNHKKRKTRNIYLSTIVLEILKQSALTSLDIIDYCLNSYPASTSEGHQAKKHGLAKRSRYREKVVGDYFEQQKEKRRIYHLIKRLEKNNLIKMKKESGGKAVWRATTKGDRELILLKSAQYLPSTVYKSQQEKEVVVVIFDILEKDRILRSWIREVLGNLGFKKIQRSVYVGEEKLPQNFISDLRDLKLLPKQVKIFSIDKKGSLFD